jgi:hypothetical protein
MTELKTLKEIYKAEDRSIYRHPDYNFMIELKAEAIKWINNCLKCGNKELFLNQRIYCHACIRFKHFFNISESDLE